MSNQFSDPRASTHIAADEIPTVQYRRSSRKFSEIKFGQNENTSSSLHLLESLKPVDLEEDEKDKDDDSEEFIFKEEYYSPEGARGWLIVFSAFCTNFVVDGISLSYGVMTEELTKTKNVTDSNGTVISVPESSISETEYQTVGSILLGVTLMMGPFASIIAEKFGFRLTAMGGSVIATLGIFTSLVLSPNEPNFWAFAVGFGLLTGIGFGILFTISVVIVGLYFSKNAPFATGITVAGTGVGTLVMSPVMDLVLERFQWQGGVIFQGILCALSFFFGAFYREVPKRVVKLRKSDVKRPGADISVKQQLKELFTSPSYMIVSFAGSLIMMGYFAPFGFLVDSAAEHIGKRQAVHLLSILGGANAIGRVIFGLLATKIGHSLSISNVALTAGGLVTALYPFAKEHHWLIICALVFGLYAAVFASLRSIVIKNIVGEEKFNVAFGLSLLFMGVATFFSNSFGGKLKEITESYDMSFYVAGGFLILSAVICYPLPCIIRYEQGKKTTVLTSQQRKSLVDVHVGK